MLVLDEQRLDRPVREGGTDMLRMQAARGDLGTARKQGFDRVVGVERRASRGGFAIALIQVHVWVDSAGVASRSFELSVDHRDARYRVGRSAGRGVLSRPGAGLAAPR